MEGHLDLIVVKLDVCILFRFHRLQNLVKVSLGPTLEASRAAVVAAVGVVVVCGLDGAIAEVAEALGSRGSRVNALKFMALVAVEAGHEQLHGNAVCAASVWAVESRMLAGVVLVVTVDWIGAESTPLLGIGVSCRHAVLEQVTLVAEDTTFVGLIAGSTFSFIKMWFLA